MQNVKFLQLNYTSSTEVMNTFSRIWCSYVGMDSLWDLSYRKSRWPFENKILKGKEQIYDIFFLWRMILFKESPSSIMVTMNPNWSTKILWYETGYVKRKILLLLKRPTYDKLHCWFYFKLLKVCWFVLWWFACNIPDASVSEYSTTDIFNSSVNKYYVARK